MKLRKIFALMLLAVFCAGIFVVHVWRQNSFVQLSQEVSKNERELVKIRNEVARLELHVSELKKMSRVERVAREKFGLDFKVTPILVHAGSDGEQGGEVRAFAWATGIMENLRDLTGKREGGSGEWATKGL